MHHGRRPHAYRNPHAMLLLAQLAARILQLEHKPPVTIALVAVNALLFFADLRQLVAAEWVPPKVLSRLLDGALQPRLVLERGEWWRLVSSAFLHLDEWHIYYNMSSLVWKGVQLELRYGSLLFAALVSELLLLSHGLYVITTVLLSSQIPDYGYLYRDLRVAGFSGVLFALKVVLMHNSPDYSQVLGIRIPTKYACWAELFLASYMIPNVSFLGHLCGVMAGWLHVRAIEPALRSSRGELRRWHVRWVNTLRRRPMPREGGRRLGGGGAAASGSAGTSGGAGGRGADDAVQRSWPGWAQSGPGAGASDDSDSDLRDDPLNGPAAGGGATPEEVRRRRLERLDRQAAAQAARSRYGSSTARRAGDNGTQRTPPAADGPSQAAAANRRYFNCGGTLGGGGDGGGAVTGRGPAPDAVRSGPAGDADLESNAAELSGGGGGGGGTTTLTDEELRRRRLDRLERPPGRP